MRASGMRSLRAGWRALEDERAHTTPTSRTRAQQARTRSEQQHTAVAGEQEQEGPPFKRASALPREQQRQQQQEERAVQPKQQREEERPARAGHCCAHGPPARVRLVHLSRTGHATIAPL